MTILDLISGNQVTIEISGKPRRLGSACPALTPRFHSQEGSGAPHWRPTAVRSNAVSAC